MATAKICLNMIVRNESKNMVRLLKSVVPFIDQYVIVDTGSTDNTIQTIQDFFLKQPNPIVGHILQEPFCNFGVTRTFALDKAKEWFPDTEYYLLVDADMIFYSPFSPNDFKQMLLKKGGDIYHVYQGSETFSTKNVRLVRGGNLGSKCKYVGVTHEYLSYPPETKLMTLTKTEAFILDIGDGGCKSDKFKRDIRLLEEDFVRDPTNGRTLFYLGNSYKDDGQHEKAIEIYKYKVFLGEKRKQEWFEEIWHSLYNIGICYLHLKRPDQAIYFWLEAFKHHPRRIENLYEICKEYRVQGKQEVSYEFYLWAKRIANNTPMDQLDFLFTQRDVYDWKLDYELSIVGYYYNPQNISMSLTSMNLLKKTSVLHQPEYRNILTNYKHYVEALPRISLSTTALGTTLSKFKIPSHIPARPQDVGVFVSSSPSLVMHQGQLWVNVRYVNYSIDGQGGYVNHSEIITRNLLYNVYTGDSVEWEVSALPNTHYKGIEDVRLYSHNDVLYYNGNRGVSSDIFQIEHGIVDWVGGKGHGHLLTSPKNNAIEKNWVIAHQMKMVYQWFPLMIGEVGVSNQLVITHTQSDGLPAFFRDLRGSTNGILVGDEIWFLCHLVSYEERRYYYHLFVVLDANSMQFKRCSCLYKLLATRNPVEYVLGMIHCQVENQIILGVSVLDRTTEFVSIDVSKISWLT